MQFTKPYESDTRLSALHDAYTEDIQYGQCAVYCMPTKINLASVILKL